LPRRKQRTRELRDHILEVAVAMLAREGVAGLTTRKLAAQAKTSTPAVYELFGDKAGVVREIFVAGFRMLRQSLDSLGETRRPRADLVRVLQTLRRFILEHPELSAVMFSRPFADFDPGPQEIEAGAAVRRFILGRVRRCIDAGVLIGDETDIGHVLVSLAHGLTATEHAGWLGRSKASIERRWQLGIDAVLAGCGKRPRHSATRRSHD
jgi:AcrR family transcriptional regulator